MNHLTIRFHPVVSLLLTLILTIGGLAVSAHASTAAGIPFHAGQGLSTNGPSFPDCIIPPLPAACTSLQVFLLIDDSSSMLYTDRSRQRVEGVKNVLDILAKEVYLPALDANPDQPEKWPNIQVSFIHFSSQVLHNSGWKTLKPESIDAWPAQLEQFDADLEIEVDYNRPQATDFIPPFKDAASLAAGLPQTDDCPRLVMLFTDGVPNDGSRNLDGEALNRYMGNLQGLVQQSFNRSNDLLYITAFGSDNTFRRFWDRDHKQKWEMIANDSGENDPRRVLYVPTQELASRMERIIGSTIGNQVYTLTPTAAAPLVYTTDIPLTVESLRLTYYTINPSVSFAVTGPDGQMIRPDGETILQTGAQTSIQVLEILKPAPGAYQITTTAAGGLLTRLLRFEKITAQLSAPGNNQLQFTGTQIGIQLLGADGEPIAITPQMRLQAALTQAGQWIDLALTPGSDTFTANWMPIETDRASVDACATLKDNHGETIVLYYGKVGEISVDPLAVQVGQPEQACVPTNKDINLPLQLVNGRSQQPVAIDAPVQLTAALLSSPAGTQIKNPSGEVDRQSGQYVLVIQPVNPGDAQLEVKAAAAVDSQSHPFYAGSTPIQIQPPRALVLTLGQPATLGDRLSKLFYLGFHPSCVDENTEIVIGRHFFNLFGSTQVQISGRLTGTAQNTSEPGIESITAQLVSPINGTSSQTLSIWQPDQTADGFSTLTFPSPGLGLYNIKLTDQVPMRECAELVSLPANKLLLINDFWEYLIIIILILFLLLLVIYLFWRYRKRRYGHEIPLILASIVLIILSLVLVNLVIGQTFKCQLNCRYLIDRPFNSDSLCAEGIGLPTEPFTIIPKFPDRDVTILGVGVPEGWFGGWTLDRHTFKFLPAMKLIDPPLDAMRQGLAGIIVVFIALASLVVTVIIRLLMNPAVRRAILTYIGLWLLFFVIFCSLFYYGVVNK